MSKIDALYEAAQKVTPVPWHVLAANAVVFGPDGSADKCAVFEGGDPRDDLELAGYIAAADPQTTMALIEAYRAVRAFRWPPAPDESWSEYVKRLVTTLRPSDANRLRAAIEKVEALE